MNERPYRKHSRARCTAGYPRGGGTRRHFRLIAYLSFTALLILSIPGTTTLVFASAPSFSTTINLSSDPGTSSYPQIAASAGYQYVVWQDDSPGRPNTFFRAGNHNGTSFGPVINLSPGTGWSQNPQIAASGNSVYTVRQDNSTSNFNILFRASLNNGASFGPIINLFSVRLDSTIPQLAASGNNVYVVWQQAGTKNPQVYFAWSNNGGASFTAINLSNDAGSALSPRVAASGNNVYVVWRDNTPGNDEVFFALSTTSGASFASTVNLSNNAGESFNPAIAVSGTNVYVAWPDNTPGNYDILFRASTNGGTSFTPSLSQPAANLSNNPGGSIEPQLAASGSGVCLSWRDSTLGNSQVFFRSSSNNGSTFTPVVNLSNDAGAAYGAQLAMMNTDVYVVWADTTPGVEDVLLASSTDGGLSFGSPINLSSNSGFSLNPALAATNVSVYVTWQDDTGGNYDVLFKIGTLFTIMAPQANAQNVLTAENKSVTITLTGSDPQGLALTFYIVSSPTHGVLGPMTLTGPSSAQVTYTPNPNYGGQDSLTFKVYNSWLNSTAVTASIIVQPSVTSGNGTGGGRLPLAK